MAEFYAKWEEKNPGRTSEPIMRLHSMAFVIPNHTPYYSFADTISVRNLPDYADYMNATGVFQSATTGIKYRFVIRI